MKEGDLDDEKKQASEQGGNDVFLLLLPGINAASRSEQDSPNSPKAKVNVLATQLIELQSV